MPQKQELSTDEKQIIVKEVSQAIDNWYESAGNNFTQNILAGIHLDDDFTLNVDGRIIHGKKDMEYYVNISMADIDAVRDLHTPQRYIRVLTRDIAVASVTYEENIIFKSGQTFPISGLFQYVYQKIDGKWKVVNMAGVALDN
jgi:hypothetical protein